MSRKVHTVVVADDHPIVISGMRLLLSGSRFFELVGEARNGAETILRCEQFRPDALLLDLRLPDLPAATICTRIKERHPETAIVILTAHPEEMAVRGCLKAGASACLFKDVNEQNLLSALMQVVHGRAVIDPRIAGAMLPRRDGDGRCSGPAVEPRARGAAADRARADDPGDRRSDRALAQHGQEPLRGRCSPSSARTTACRPWPSRRSAG